MPKRLFGAGLRGQLVKGSVASLVIRVAHAFLALAVAIVLARLMGPEGYGLYSFVLALLMLVSVPAQLGVPKLVVRETAKAQVDEDYGLMRGLWRWSNFAVAVFSTLSLILVACGVFLAEMLGESARTSLFISGFALIPLIAFANVRSACLRGLRKVVLGQLPESIVRPALFLVLVAIWSVWQAEEQLAPLHAMALYVLSASLAFLFGYWLLRRGQPVELMARPTARYRSEEWRRAVVPLAMIAGLQIINTYSDLIILGVLRTDQEVGIYRATFQLSMLVIFGLQSMQLVLQPHFSRLYHQGNHAKLQRVVTAGAKSILFLALLPVIVFMFFGESLLATAFGIAFVSGYGVLVILSLGQLINAGFGIVGPLLVVAGHERIAVKGMMISASLNLILNLILIPVLGMFGAALATGISLVVWNLLLWRSLKRLTGINSAAY